MSPAPVRFRDPGTGYRAYSSSVLVRCPRCGRLAHFTRGAQAPGSGLLPGPRVVCRSCGLCRSGPRSSTARCGRGSGPLLWLTARTRHGTLWAYNLEHLDQLRRFVAAGLREHAPWYEHGRKMTVVARLPSWVTSAKNRAEILRALDRMRASVTRG
ncbi:hypothetical protein AB0E88_13900 [Streptomyces sp. NPDC028635]|uniref:hypothetical protein n=1 Tax=Streptomyces sp. NPDC028635 TaxID=3154800 RepID=UPI0033BFF992